MATRAIRLASLAVLAAALLAIAPPHPAAAQAEPQAPGVTISFFWGDGCPHCSALRPFLEELDELPGVELRDYEVWYDDENRDLFERVAEAHGISADGVPGTFIAGGAWIGNSDAYRAAMEKTVRRCAGGGCPDVAGAIAEGGEAPTIPEQARPETGETVIDVPFLGSHDVSGDSLLWATALIAFVDGFNPCSLWVLTILIAMILRTGSRARLALIGGTYLTTVAVVYGLFLVGLFSAFAVVDYSWGIRVGVATFALAFAAVNVKDYFAFGRGVSLTIPDRFKPDIARSARAVAFEQRSLPVVAGATAALAAGVSLLELPCTVGFPVVWTNLLAERGVPSSEYAFLLAVYLLVFLVDEALILGAALVAMRIGRVQEREGRVLKLAGGMLMAVLGVVMLVDPGVLEDVAGAALVFALAAVLTALVLVATSGIRRRRAAPAPGRPPRTRGPRQRPQRPAPRHR